MSRNKKFAFCGNLDCPDWILAQLFHASRLSLERFEMMCNSVKTTITCDGQFDVNQFDSLDLDDDGFDIDDARCCFAAIHLVMTHARLYDVSITKLQVELEQLGLPTEHSRILCENLSALR